MQVVECPRLMNAVFSEFLPLVWNPAEGVVCYNYTCLGLPVCVYVQKVSPVHPMDNPSQLL